MKEEKEAPPMLAAGGAQQERVIAGTCGSLTTASLLCNRPACRCHRRPGPNGYARLHCPAETHPTPGDPGPSLSVRITGGKLHVVRCWAGCPREAILKALGLRDTPPDPSERPATRKDAPPAWDPTDPLVPVHQIVRAACRCTGHRHPWRLRGESWLGDCPVPNCQREFEYALDLLRPSHLWVWCRGVDNPCPPEAIYQALGLPSDGRLYRKNGGIVLDGHEYRPDGGIPNPEAWLLEYCRLDRLPESLRDHIRFTGAWVCFLFPGASVEKWREAGTKNFKWEPPGQKPPYVVFWPMPDAVLPETIYVTEGENDCIVLRAAGLPAFSMTAGAGTQIPQAVWYTLKGRGVRRVVLLLDADAEGRRGAERLAGNARMAGLDVVDLDLARVNLVDYLSCEKDIRDAWRSGHFPTPEAFRGAILKAVEGARGSTGLTSALKEGAAEVSLPPTPRRVDILDLGDAAGTLESLPLLGLEGYIIRGWGHVLAGYPKAGKTELLYACARTWVEGGLRVLWLSEETESVWRARLTRRGKPARRGLEVVFALGADPADLLRVAVESGCDIVVVDTIRTVFRLEDESDNAAVALTLSAWEAALQGKTRIYVHHVRKSGGDFGHAIAGASAFLAAVDRALELKFDTAQPETRRQLDVYSRIEVPPPLLYELDGTGFKPLGSPEAVAIRGVETRILAFLEAAEPGRWYKTAEIRKGLGEPEPGPDTVLRVLRGLHERGLIERDPPENRRGATYRWRLHSPPLARTPN